MNKKNNFCHNKECHFEFEKKTHRNNLNHLQENIGNQ